MRSEKSLVARRLLWSRGLVTNFKNRVALGMRMRSRVLVSMIA